MVESSGDVDPLVVMRREMETMRMKHERLLVRQVAKKMQATAAEKEVRQIATLCPGLGIAAHCGVVEAYFGASEALYLLQSMKQQQRASYLQFVGFAVQ